MYYDIIKLWVKHGVLPEIIGRIAMNQQQVVDLMKTSKSEKEWNTNCDKVKKACGGYPSFWYAVIIMGGVLAETQAKHGW